MGSKIEAGLSKDKDTGKITDYAVALKIASQAEDLGVWDPTYFADDIRFDHKINGFERLGSLNLVLETDFAKKSAPVLKAQKQSQTNDYQCRKI